MIVALSVPTAVATVDMEIGLIVKARNSDSSDFDRYLETQGAVEVSSRDWLTLIEVAFAVVKPRRDCKVA